MSEEKVENAQGEVIIYQTDEGDTKIDVRFVDETVWLTQAQLVELLKAYKHDQDCYKAELGSKLHEHDRLFIKWNGEPMHPNTPYTWLMREGRRKDFPFYGIHTFRHLFASIEIEAGIDPTTVAATLGHSTPITTMSTYSHYFAQSKQRASNAVAEFLEKSG